MKKLINKNLKIGALSGFVVLAGCHHEDLSTAEVERILNSFDYIKLRLPSTTYNAGDLVHRVNYAPEVGMPSSTSLGHLCSPKFSTDKYNEEPIRSASESRKIFRNMSGKFSVSPGVLAEAFNFDLSATANAAKQLQVSLVNVEIHSFALDDLGRIRNSLGPVCTKYVQDNIVKGNAYQIERTLTATVKVEAQLDAGVSAELRALAIAELGELGVGVSSSNKATINGEALVYGIRWQPLF